MKINHMFGLLLLLFTLESFSQAYMVIHRSDGTEERIPVESIQKVTFDLSTVSIQPGAAMPSVKKVNKLFNKVIQSSHSARIKYSVENAGQVNITVYDVKGRKIHTILNRHMSPGAHSIVWNGTDSYGGKLSAGPYLLDIRAGSKTSQHLLILN